MPALAQAGRASKGRGERERLEGSEAGSGQAGRRVEAEDFRFPPTNLVGTLLKLSGVRKFLKSQFMYSKSGKFR